MSEKPIGEKPTKPGTGSGAESPTTARELDFDDDNETPAPASEQVTSPPPPSKSPKPGVRFSDDATEIPPPKPPRPMSPQQQSLNTLIEAFPSIDPITVKAMLVSSRGDLESAFNGLLSMSDPNFKIEETPPPQPPRPRPTQPRTQVEQDEIYARQLAEHYQSNDGGYGSRARGDPPLPQRRQQSGLKPNELHDDEGPSFEDEIKEIGQTIQESFNQTRENFSKFFGNIRSKLEGDEETYDKYGDQVNRRQNFGPSQSDQLHGIRRSAEARRSADRDRYDSDNRMLGDDFEALELRDDETPANQRSNRPLANPDLFKPTPVSPPQSGPVDEVDALYRNPSPNGQQTGVTGNKSGGKKWQPLTSIAPNPESDEHDPFSLGDSDDEDAKTKDIKAEDTERLKKAAETKEATSSELKPAGRSGSVGQIDAAAEALLKDTK
ncbi:ubiquitin-binding protein cue5 [Kalmusia sp. IMI 367209]|nr:ubiquitin-binding protein cue5 [Kalmusia sp. IMI 367209]